MSLTTWIEATERNTLNVGTIGHRVANTSVAQKSVVTWEHGSQSVLLGESNLLGRKRAVYAVLNNPRVIAQIRKLEDQAAQRIALEGIAATDAEVAFVLPGYRTVIESDPYVAA